MSLDLHPIILFYLAGCVLVVVLIFFKIILFWTIDWIIKANILKKNLRKVLPPNAMTFMEKGVRLVLTLVVEALLSWINVVVILWQIAATLLRTARDLLSPAPEEIKLLRFPLRNNPDMPRESVWAYLLALQVKAGEKQPSETILVGYLSELSDIYPSFDRIAALKQLESLNVISSDVISASLTQLREISEGNIMDDVDSIA